MKALALEIPIYTYDIDFNHHVSNISYIRWMENARLKLLQEVGLPVHEIEQQGFAPLLTRTEISYKQPLYLGDQLRIEISVSKMRKTSGSLRFRFIRNDDELVAEAEQDTLFVATDTRKVYRLSDAQRGLFLPYLETH